MSEPEQRPPPGASPPASPPHGLHGPHEQRAGDASPQLLESDPGDPDIEMEVPSPSPPPAAPAVPGGASGASAGHLLELPARSPPSSPVPRPGPGSAEVDMDAAMSLGSGIASLELCEVVTTTGRSRAAASDTKPARLLQADVQPAISYEMVVDTQVAPHLKQEPPPPPQALQDRPLHLLLHSLHSTHPQTSTAPTPASSALPPALPSAMSSALPPVPVPSPAAPGPAVEHSRQSLPCSELSYTSHMMDVLDGPGASAEVREVKGPTSDPKMSVFVPTPSLHELQLVTGREPPEDDGCLSPAPPPPPRPSPQKSLLSRSPRMSPRRGLSRALSGGGGGGGGSPGHEHRRRQRGAEERVRAGDSTPLSLLSTNVFDIDWKLWWADRVRRVEERMQRERQHAEARMMRESLSLAAYSLGAHLLPSVFGLKRTASSAPSLFSIPSSAATAGTGTSSLTSALLPGPGPGTRRSRLRSGGASTPSRASRRVSFSDIGYSLTAQPPSSAHSKPRRPGDKRPVVLEEPSAYLRFLRRSDRHHFRPAWRPQPDDILKDTRADQTPPPPLLRPP